MHHDVARFLAWVHESGISDRRLRMLFWKIVDNDVGESMVPNKELTAVLRAIELHRPQLLAKDLLRQMKRIASC